MKNYQIKPQINKIFHVIPLVYFFVSIGIACKGQVIPEKTLERIKSNSLRDGTPLQGVHIVGDLDNPGCVFLDSTGKPINFIPERELYARNPYVIEGLDPLKDNSSEAYKLYSMEGRSSDEIKQILPNKLHFHPTDSILAHLSLISVFVNDWYFDYDHKQYFVMSYICDLFGTDGVEKWAETTTCVYDHTGVLISKFQDNHSVQVIYITPDGKYLLANKMINVFGDCRAEFYNGILVYDVSLAKPIGNVIRLSSQPTIVTNLQYGHNKPQYFDHLITGYFYKYEINRSDNVEVNEMVIDPVNKVLYYKTLRDGDFSSGKPAVRIKSPTYPNGQDIKSFQMMKF